MNNIIYDKIDNSKINNFLLELYNSNRYSKDDIYNRLCYYGLPSYDIPLFMRNESLSYNQEEIRQSIHFNNATEIQYWGGQNEDYWLNFKNYYSKPDDKTNKLYIPVSSKDYTYTVKAVLEFLDQNNIKHDSKIGKGIRSDNFVVRIKEDGMDDTLKVINFINSNNRIKQNLNEVNPFTPKINGIGYMKESGISYNSCISILISDYISKRKMENKNVEISDFLNWINTNSIPSISKYYEKLNGRVPLEVIKQEVLNTLFSSFDINLQKEESQSYQDKNFFLDAIKATYIKYGIEQVKKALIEILNNNNYEYITNGNYNYRIVLANNYSNDKIKNYIYEIAGAMNISAQNKNTNDLVEFLCLVLFNSDLSYKFDEACMATYYKYGEKATTNAIKKLIFEKNPNYFTRFSNNTEYNYREQLVSMDYNSIIYAISNSLVSRGINISNTPIENIIDKYVEVVIQNNYTSNFEDTPQLRNKK